MLFAKIFKTLDVNALKGSKVLHKRQRYPIRIFFKFN